MLSPEDKSHWIKNLVTNSGFDYCGISAARFLEEEATHLETWLQNSFHGEMSYMERNIDKRLDPRQLVPGAKSVITLMKNYYQASAQTEIKSSRYAFGLDYHEVIKEKMRALIATMQAEWGMFEHRSFVDSAPVLERAWARNSGLGWVGKNSMLIHPKAGSNYFLAVIILDVELRYDDPLAKDYCGSCQRCIDACPTDAIVSPKVVDARKCISYLSIELKGEMPTNAPAYDSWVFGCDVCNDVCPWNRFAKQHQEPSFLPLNTINEWTKADWEALSEESFATLFKHSPIKRSKWNGLQRNLRHILKEKQ